ncbi:ribonuclease Oy-like [Tropilaelaps mercedesae]|uniref:Ribonuclease Oy-like n=1 Tax=Tropilaelaps mercedesae TaxID=418985 RepID=A0A1V9Y2T5_9ACAR|nr:ribonuclease Oy-like [Tropilaelaps mercedesae]
MANPVSLTVTKTLPSSWSVVSLNDVRCCRGEAQPGEPQRTDQASSEVIAWIAGSTPNGKQGDSTKRCSCSRMKFIAGTLEILAVLVLLADSYSAESAHNNQSKVEFYQLGLWTRSGFCAAKGGCVRLEENATTPIWTIHGLWPMAKSGVIDPVCCNNTKFDRTVVQQLVNELNVIWPSFTLKRAEMVWEDEYNRHGVCALPPINATVEYFTAAINLYSQNRIDEWLKKAEIMPNDTQTFPLERIKAAIVTDHNNESLPALDFYCEGQRDGADILQEIRFCYDTRFFRMQCSSQSSTCTTKDVWYLKSSGFLGAPSVLLVLVSCVLALLTSKH